tara:strand:+ start:964 stop:1488 length:525 start_codon:yes stop_codon:yes gene_type:complete
MMSYAAGDAGELMWRLHLERKGFEIEAAPKRVFYDWDMKSTRGDSVTTYEVKYDEKAYWWAQRRGKPEEPNLYIEFKSTKRNGPSGILLSKSDYYVYILKRVSEKVSEADGSTHSVTDNLAYIYDRVKLCSFCQEGGFRVVGNKATGDDNAEGWIPPVSETLNDAAGFVKLIFL